MVNWISFFDVIYDFKFLEKSGIPIFIGKYWQIFWKLGIYINTIMVKMFNDKDILIDGNNFSYKIGKKRALS